MRKFQVSPIDWTGMDRSEWPDEYRTARHVPPPAVDIYRLDPATGEPHWDATEFGSTHEEALAGLVAKWPGAVVEENEDGGWVVRAPEPGAVVDERGVGDLAPLCSICDGLGHGYPGGPPCPIEDRGPGALDECEIEEEDLPPLSADERDRCYRLANHLLRTSRRLEATAHSIDRAVSYLPRRWSSSDQYVELAEHLRARAGATSEAAWLLLPGVTSSARTVQADDPTNPAWAGELHGTPATAEQIEASERAEQGLIRVDRTGRVASGSDTARVWVD